MNNRMSNRRVTWIIFLSVVIAIHLNTFAALNITRQSEWGSGEYLDVFVSGNYAYCAASGTGLDIIDIRNPANLIRVGHFDTSGIATAVHVKNNVAYIADSGSGLQIIDVSNPFSPMLVANYGTTQNANGIFIEDDTAYMIDWDQGLQVIDVSNPRAPTLKGEFGMNSPRGIWVEGIYAYVIVSSGLKVMDVSKPAFPRLVGEYKLATPLRDICVRDHTAYLAGTVSGLTVLDLSNPLSPSLTGALSFAAEASSVFVEGNYAYVSVGNKLQKVDISAPSSLSVMSEITSGPCKALYADKGSLYTANGHKGLEIIHWPGTSGPNISGGFNISGTVLDIATSGTISFLAHGKSGVRILDHSDITKLKHLGTYHTPGNASGVFVTGNFLYVLDSLSGLMILDISDVSLPVLKGSINSTHEMLAVAVSGNYAYVAADEGGLIIVDISEPTSPLKKGGYKTVGSSNCVTIHGNYAYLGTLGSGVTILDITDPAAPVFKQTFGAAYPMEIFIKDDMLSIAHLSGLQIHDISDAVTPVQLGSYTSLLGFSGVWVDSNFAYVTDGQLGMLVLDLGNPSFPVLEGSYQASWQANDVIVSGGNILLSDYSGKLVVFQDVQGAVNPVISVDREKLRFASNNAGAYSGGQSIAISNSGGGNMSWQVTVNQGWMRCSPESGTNSREVFVSINTTGMATGTYQGTLEIIAPMAENSPLMVDITLNILEAGETAMPFGEFSTPLQGSTVSSSIPFTGWVLDDIGVKNVKLFREIKQGGMAYIGDATFVPGARPDVAEAYPDYPNNSRAGWGYMMLSNFLPQGNGTFQIHAIATDVEGQKVTLGIRTIQVENKSAIKPFGAIDTPMQGGTASGSRFVNFGWVLTPQPNTIPKDGSNIRVWVDGVLVGNPVYNLYREDIADQFPGYNNSDGAVGYFLLDTTAYANGVHTIQWTASDDGGNSDGIGSRYFSIQNVMPDQGVSSDRKMPALILPDDKAPRKFQCRELNRLEIPFYPDGVDVFPTAQLPVGSTLDKRRGIFYWQLGPGFIGIYTLHFIIKEPGLKNKWRRKSIQITVLPKVLPEGL